MRQFLIACLLLVLSVPSFAGAFIDDSSANNPLISNPESASVLPTEKIIERTIVMKEAKDIKPLYGLSLGFVGDYPLLGYCTKDLFIDAGFKNIDGDTSAMILAGGIVRQSLITLPKYARLRVGLALNPGLTFKPLAGLFAGIEDSLDERIVVFADAFYWFGNNHFAYPTVSAGAKIII